MNNLKFILIASLFFAFTGCGNTDVKSEKVNLTDAKIRLYINKAQQDPGNYRNYDNLAYYYFQKARETGNSDFYNLAENAVNRSLEIKPDSFTGTVFYSKLKLANHEFNEALKYAKMAVRLKPGSGFSYGILGDAYLELHQIRNAEKAYKKMVELNPSLDSYGRMSNLMHHMHNHKGAVRYMELAYEEGLRKSSTPPENLAWTQVMLGEIYIESGNTAKAERYFKKALEIYEGYYLAEKNLKKISAGM